MVKIGICLVLAFTLQLNADENRDISDLDELQRINQKVMDVFKDTEFDYDTPTEDYEDNKSFANPQVENSRHSISYFKVQYPTEALKHIDSFMLKELLDSCPQTLLNDIQNTIHISTNQIFRNSPHYTDQMTRLLLVGPQGSGKSSLALAIAYKLNRPYLFISAASLANEYKNSAITIINNLFDPIIESEVPAVIILDEITAFTKRFEDKNDSDPGAIEHLWIKLDACKKNPNLLVIFTANNTDKIPDTIKDRLSASEFFISHPDINARKRIIEHYLSSCFTFNKQFLNYLAKETKGFTLREINMFISRTKNKAFNRVIRKSGTLDEKLPVKKEDIELALQMLRTSHNTEIKRKNKEYYKEILSTVSPQIIPLISMLINIYLQVKFHDQQMAFTKLSHEETMQHNRLVHWDTIAQAIENSEIQQDFALYAHEESKMINERHHKENLLIQREHYKDSKNNQNATNMIDSLISAGTTLLPMVATTNPIVGIGVGLATRIGSKYVLNK